PVDPAKHVESADARKLRTDLEQRARRILAPALKKALGTEVDIQVKATSNADGTMEINLQARQKGQDGPAAEITVTVDPAAKSVSFDGMRAPDSGETGNVARLLFLTQADFLSHNFAGFEIKGGASDKKLFGAQFSDVISDPKGVTGK